MSHDAPTPRSVPAIRRRTLLAGTLAGLLLAGCGQKGELYFPEDRIEEEKAKRKSSSRGRHGPAHV